MNTNKEPTARIAETILIENWTNRLIPLNV